MRRILYNNDVNENKQKHAAIVQKYLKREINLIHKNKKVFIDISVKKLHS